MFQELYYVYYPNATRTIWAIGPHDAESRAESKWGTKPLGVMLADQKK